MVKKGEMERETTYLEVEKSRISREKAKIALDMGLILYFGFLIVGVVGFAFEYIDSLLLNVLVICGIIILIVSTLPYLIIIHKEERWINSRLGELKK